MPYVGDIHKHEKFHIQEYVKESFMLEINYKRLWKVGDMYDVLCSQLIA